MLSWDEWKNKNSQNISHIAGFEEIFVDSILRKIPEISPEDVISQYHFTDFNEKNRYIDFMIINTSKGYQLPIELDGYSKLELERDYSKFNDFLERQNALTAKFGILLRYTNKKMFNEQSSIINEIRDVLNKQGQKLSTEQINNKHIQTTIQDYEEMNSSLQEQVAVHNNTISQKESTIHQTIKEIQHQLNDLTKQKAITQQVAASPIPTYPSNETFSIKKIVIGGSILLLCLVIGSFIAKEKLNANALKSELNMPPSKTISAKESTHLNSISADQAHQFIGTNQTVCGQIVEIKNFSKGQYLNFSKAFPNQPFTAVVWSNDMSSVGNIDSNQKLCVTGPITSFKGKPQMQIKTSQQISFI